MWIYNVLHQMKNQKHLPWLASMPKVALEIELHLIELTFLEHLNSFTN